MICWEKSSHLANKMNKSQKSVLKFFDHSSELHIKNAGYKKCIDRLFSWLLENDNVKQDITTKILFSEKSVKRIETRIITRANITVAGVEEIIYFVKRFTDLKLKVLKNDGERAQTNDVIVKLSGNAQEVLIFERTILNILQRLCGIATETNKNVAFIKSLKLKKPPVVAATRKTIWSLLDKKAVSVGGGVTHRLKLSDGILVKDNHLLILKQTHNAMSEQDAALKTLEAANKKVKNTLIEIEVEQKESIPILINTFLKGEQNNMLGILLDNFNAKTAKSTIDSLQKYDLSNVVFEASGSITTENLSSWADSGVDVISLGALTHSVKSADLSLEIL